MLIYILDGLDGDGKPLFRSRAAVVSPRIEEPSLFEGVPFLLGGSRVDGGGLYIVLSRRAKANSRNQSEAWALFRELRAIGQGVPVRTALEALSSRIGQEAITYRQRANVWSLMLLQWVLTLPAEDGYLQGRTTLGERLLREIVPDIDRGTDLDRRQGWSILVRIFGDLREIAPAASFGISPNAPLVNLAGDEELLEELDLRARNHQDAMEAAVRIYEGEARLFVMACCMLPLCSGVVVIDAAVAAAQNLLAFEIALRDADLIDGEQSEWDGGVLLAGVLVFVPALRVVPYIGRVVNVGEVVLFAVGVLAFLINMLDQLLQGMERLLAALESGFDSYTELDTGEFFELRLPDAATP